MKKLLITFFIAGAVLLLWYFISPLFINQTVDEALPIQETTGTDVVPNRDVTSQPVDPNMPPEIILGNYVNVDEAMMPMPQPTIERIGEFVGADRFHEAEGNLIAVSDLESQFLRFEDFNVTNGPELVVLLSDQHNPAETGELGDYIELSSLKGNKGNQNYMLGDIDISEYKSVVIYCKPFHVVFGSASINID